MRVIKLIVSLLLLFGGGASLYGLNSISKMSDPDDIQILPKSDILEGIPRGPVFNPFSAYRLGNQVILGSSVSYGSVAVTLWSTAGDSYTTIFDTEDGVIIIPISGSAGDYTLLLADSFGARFIGEFSLD